MRQFSFFWQIFLMIFCVLIIPTSLIAYYAMQDVAKYAEDNIAVSKLDNLESVSDATELILSSYTRNVIQFANSAAYRNLGQVTSYQELNIDFEMVRTAWDAQSYLSRVFGTEKMVQSCFYVGKSSDFVISSDKNICRLENYASLDWMKDKAVSETGIRGEWIARELYNNQDGKDGGESQGRSKIPVLSYVYSISPLITAKGGYIVCNIYNSRLSEFINPSNQASGVCYILDEDRNIICHPDNAFFLGGEENQLILDNIFGSKQRTGYFDYEKDGVRYLCAFKRSSFNNWTYVVNYSMDEIMRQVKSVTSTAMLIIMFAIAVEMVLVLLISYWIFKPFRMLFNNVKENMTEGMTEKASSKNEVYYLNEVFKKMKSEESQIHDILEKKNSDAQRLHLREMLTGTLESREKKESFTKMFPYEHFMVLLASVDDGSEMLRKYNSDERMFYFLQIEELFTDCLSQEGYEAKSIRFRSTTCAVVLNIKTYDQRKTAEYITDKLELVKQQVRQIFDYTLTIGISAVHADINDLNEGMAEATAAVKHRIIAGKNQVIFWNPRMNESKRYYYPYTSENKIINYLKQQNTEAVYGELELVRKQLSDIEDISYDNVVLVYQQMIGAIIKAMMEEKIQISKFMGNGRQAYTTIAEKDTIEEIELFVKGFIRQIQDYLGEVTEEKEDVKLYDRIIAYLDEHYKEDIDYEEAAGEIGISYSYMRRVVKEGGDISMVDYVNRLRIHEAKKLLLTTDLKIPEIAGMVGYHNVQSLNRFFKKYEGTTPNSVRDLEKK